RPSPRNSPTKTRSTAPASATYRRSSTTSSKKPARRRNPMSTEYDQYSIEELYEMTRGDDPDAMEKQAQGWSNSAALYKSKYENMQKHFEAIRTSWTSASAEPYLKHIAFTARALETAWVDSNMKA